MKRLRASDGGEMDRLLSDLRKCGLSDPLCFAYVTLSPIVVIVAVVVGRSVGSGCCFG